MEPQTRPAWGELIAGDRFPRVALVFIGTWLTAAETLMTATIMPSVAAEIGGYAWFGWVVAVYMTGAILAGATSGWLSTRLGLRRALALGAIVYAAGCVASAVAPDIGLFLAGRLLQGVGGGWIAGLCYVAVHMMFPQRFWPLVLGSVAGVWGVATLLSPLIGGLFAEAGFWRGAFWLFAVQGVGFIGAALWLAPASAKAGEEAPLSGLLAPLSALTGAILAIAAAGMLKNPWLAAALGAAGCALLALFLRLNAGVRAALLPRSAADPRSGTGAGLAAIFALQASTVAFTVYGAAMMQALHGASPVLAGYVLGCEALSWTVAALAVAASARSGHFIRLGAWIIFAGVVGLAAAVPWGSVGAVAALAAVQGAGFGFAWAFLTGRIVGCAGPEELALASGSVPTAQMIATAVGAAAAGTIANLLGFGDGIDAAKAAAKGVWLFGALAPLTLLGVLAAGRAASFKI
jgi:MFS family permease